MLNSSAGPLRPRVLIVDDALARPETALGSAALNLVSALETRNVEVAKALSLADGTAIVGYDASLASVMLNWNLSDNDAATHAEAAALLSRLRERHAATPVFLLADRKSTRGSMTIEIAEMVDEFVWLLEDTADFVAGRVLAAIKRYRAQLLPPYARVLAEYSQLREHSWSAPGHQGGIAFTKHPAGRAFFDFLGENSFRIDMGIERGVLGSLLDHTGQVAESEKYAARVFGAHRSYSGVVGTSGSNRSIIQACMKEDDIVVDRNCHKSIEQGLMLTGRGWPTWFPPGTATASDRFLLPRWKRRQPRQGEGGTAHPRLRRPEAGLCGSRTAPTTGSATTRCGRRLRSKIERPDSFRRSLGTGALQSDVRELLCHAGRSGRPYRSDGLRHALDAQASRGALAVLIHSCARR
jgi:hypothetical protein